MKLRKPEDEKYFKDVTLNHILSEISSENKESIPKHHSDTQKKKSKNSFYLSILFFALLPLLLLILFFMPLNITSKQTPQKNSNQHTAKKDIQNRPSTLKKDIPPLYKKVEKNKQSTKSIQKVPQKPKIQTLSVREQAKKDLLEQMKR